MRLHFFCVRILLYSRVQLLPSAPPPPFCFECVCCPEGWLVGWLVGNNKQAKVRKVDFPMSGHNDIPLTDTTRYYGAIKAFLSSLSPSLLGEDGEDDGGAPAPAAAASASAAVTASAAAPAAAPSSSVPASFGAAGSGSGSSSVVKDKDL